MKGNTFGELLIFFNDEIFMKKGIEIRLELKDEYYLHEKLQTKQITS